MKRLAWLAALAAALFAVAWLLRGERPPAAEPPAPFVAAVEKEAPAEPAVPEGLTPARRAIETASDRLRGRLVMKDGGSPPPNAVVFVVTGDPRFDREAPRAEASADGSFEIAVPPDSLRFSFDVAASFAVYERDGAWYAPGDPALDGIVLWLEPAGEVEGFVGAPGGRTFAGAHVSMKRPDETKFGRVASYEATTDANGRFALRGLPASTYSVYVKAHGVDAWKEDGFDVHAGEVAKLEVLLDTGPFIAGRVVDRSDTGWTSRLSLHLHRQDAPSEGVPVRTQDTAQDGTFFLGSLKPGRYSLYVRPLDGRLGAERHGLYLATEGGIEPLRIVLPEGRFVSGHVLDAWGLPVFGARVEARNDWTERRERRSPIVRVETRTDETGAFRLEGLDEGPLALLVGAEARASVETLGIHPDVLGLTIELPPATGFAGRVLDERSGTPLARFSLRTTRVERGEGRSRWESGPICSFDSADGTFEMTGLREGTYEVVAESQGFAALKPLTVEVRAGEIRRDVVIRLQVGATIRGIVRGGATGSPVAGAIVSASYGVLPGRRDAMDPGPSARTTIDGAFELRGLRSGLARVLAEKPGHPQARSRALEIVSGEAIDGVELSFPVAGAIEGWAGTPHGNPIAGAFVRASEADWTEWSGNPHAGVTLTRTDGTFRIENLRSGRYEVTVSPSHVPLRAWVDVAAGATARVGFESQERR